MNPLKPLETLDELIFKQYEKLTHKAYETLGWTKYDLIELTYKSVGMSCTGIGAYLFLLNHSQPQSSLAFDLFTTSIIGVGVISYTHVAKSLAEKQRRNDFNNMKNNQLYAPKTNPSRFFRGVAGAAFTVGGIYNLNTSKTDTEILLHLSCTAAGLSHFLISSYEYFKDQIPQPPTTKKSLLDYLTPKFSLQKPNTIPLQQ